MGCHFLLQGIFLTQGIKPGSPALQADSCKVCAAREAPGVGVVLPQMEGQLSGPQPLFPHTSELGMQVASQSGLISMEAVQPLDSW